MVVRLGKELVGGRFLKVGGLGAELVHIDPHSQIEEIVAQMVAIVNWGVGERW